MTIYEPGSHCYLAGDIEALIIAVAIRSAQYCAYEVVWYDGPERRCEWVTEAELSKHKLPRKHEVGFR